MGVAVDHPRHAKARKPRLHGGRGHIGDRFRLPAGQQLPVACLAGGTRLLGKGQPCCQRLRQKLRLPVRIARLRAELLVRGVVAAQQIAVQKQRRRAVQVDDGGIVQYRHPAACRVARAQ